MIRGQRSRDPRFEKITPAGARGDDDRVCPLTGYSGASECRFYAVASVPNLNAQYRLRIPGDMRRHDGEPPRVDHSCNVRTSEGARSPRPAYLTQVDSHSVCIRRGGKTGVAAACCEHRDIAGRKSSYSRTETLRRRTTHEHTRGPGETAGIPTRPTRRQLAARRPIGRSRRRLIATAPRDGQSRRGSARSRSPRAQFETR